MHWRDLQFWLALGAALPFWGVLLALAPPGGIHPQWPLHAPLAFLLPVTHAIRLMQDVMLRGMTLNTWEYGALAAIAAVTLFIAWVGLRRSMVRA